MSRPTTSSTLRPTSSSTRRSQTSSFTQKLENHDVEQNEDNEISWSPQSSEHPRNWSKLIKIEVTLIICWLEFFMTAMSTAGTAVADASSKEYGLSQTMGYFVFVTMYMIGQTIGGIFCSPISEVFGRRTLYAVATALFVASSIIVAAPPSVIAVYFGRFFQGLAAAIPATVAYGNFEDMYDAHARVWTIYWYTVAGNAGLIVGPIYSVYVIETIGWRWVFYISTIASALSLIACFFVKESNADQILQSKAEKMREETGRDSLKAEGVDESGFSIKSFMQDSLFRPLSMLVTEPLVFFCAALCGIAFGLVYGLTEGLNIVYTAPPFNFSDSSASLSFLAIFIGELLDILPRFYDDYLLKRERHSGRRILPETKIRSFAIACPSLAIGLWIFGWTIPPRITTVPWSLSMIGLICVGFSLNDFSYVLFGYITDSYGKNAASAAGAVGLTRGIMAGIFPLFTTQMFEGLGSNIAVTILAATATAFCFTPWLFLKYGAQLRRKSKTASNDEDCLQEENKHLEDEEMRNFSQDGG